MQLSTVSSHILGHTKKEAETPTGLVFSFSTSLQVPPSFKSPLFKEKKKSKAFFFFFPWQCVCIDWMGLLGPAAILMLIRLGSRPSLCCVRRQKKNNGEWDWLLAELGGILGLVSSVWRWYVARKLAPGEGRHWWRQDKCDIRPGQNDCIGLMQGWMTPDWLEYFS